MKPRTDFTKTYQFLNRLLQTFMYGNAVIDVYDIEQAVRVTGKEFKTRVKVVKEGNSAELSLLSKESRIDVSFEMDGELKTSKVFFEWVSKGKAVKSTVIVYKESKWITIDVTA